MKKQAAIRDDADFAVDVGDAAENFVVERFLKKKQMMMMMTLEMKKRMMMADWSGKGMRELKGNTVCEERKL